MESAHRQGGESSAFMAPADRQAFVNAVLGLELDQSLNDAIAQVDPAAAELRRQEQRVQAQRLAAGAALDYTDNLTGSYLKDML